MRWRSLRAGYRNPLEGLRRMRPHEILGLPEHPTALEVKHAYRAKVKAYHPDRVDPFLRPQAEEMVKLLNAAYAALMERCK
jgi:curved DNA-binding protein CbpA